jgi:hypothetical protein
VCSAYAEPRDRGLAKGLRDPTTGKRLCGSCFRGLYPHLSRGKVRREQLALAELQRLAPELGPPLVWDCTIPGQSCSDARPDMVWKIGDRLVQVEIDENGRTHEDSTTRLAGLQAATNATEHFVIRFCCDEAFRMKRLTNGVTMWYPSVRFTDMMAVLVEAVREAAAGRGPWKVRLFFEEAEAQP